MIPARGPQTMFYLHLGMANLMAWLPEAIIQAIGSWARQVWASRPRQAILEFRPLAAGLGKSRQVGHDSKSQNSKAITRKAVKTPSQLKLCFGKIVDFGPHAQRG